MEIALLWFFSDVRGYTVSESGWEPHGGQEELRGEKGGGTFTFLCVPFVSFTFSTMCVLPIQKGNKHFLKMQVHCKKSEALQKMKMRITSNPPLTSLPSPCSHHAGGGRGGEGGGGRPSGLSREQARTRLGYLLFWNLFCFLSLMPGTHLVQRAPL